MKKNLRSFLYEIIMFILALVSVSFIWIDSTSFQWLDWFIWAIFVIDVSVRFMKSENKWLYIKQNPLDIIAIIPLDSIFRMARIARIFKIIRLISMSSHFLKPVFGVINTNGLNRVITITFVLIFVSSVPIYLVEPNIGTYEDALWWSTVTATTVGYGDLSPETGIGRGIAVILMIVGIGLIGMVTGSVATYFMGSKKEDIPVIGYMKKELDRHDEWTNEEIDRLIQILNSMKKTKEETLITLSQ